MDIFEHNKKVAIARWANVHNKEKEFIVDNPPLKARLAGYLAGDGSVIVTRESNKPTHFAIKFYPDHISLVNSYVQAFKILYNKEPKVIAHKNFFSVIVYSKTIVEDLLKLGSFGKLKWRAPMEILNSQEAKKEWLMAIFDCEGYVGKNQIKIQTVNKEGIADIKNLLLEFGIKANSYVYHPKNNKWNTVYILSINKKSERIKFLNSVGFHHSIKLGKLNAAIA